MVKVALITGASKGLGRGAAESLALLGYEVLLSSKNIETSLDAVQSIGLTNIKPLALDVSLDSDVQKIYEMIVHTYGRLDVLINNAGVYLERRHAQFPDSTQSSFNTEDFEKTLNVNLLGAYRLISAFLPLMKKQKFGRIVNVSSGMGRLSKMEYSSLYYCLSKLSMNGLTIAVHKELQNDPDIKINSVCPGWVNTSMGTSAGPRSIEEGIKGIVWAATLPVDGPSGQFFRDETLLHWSDCESLNSY